MVADCPGIPKAGTVPAGGKCGDMFMCKEKGSCCGQVATDKSLKTMKPGK
jgi:hypothetical protein